MTDLACVVCALRTWGDSLRKTVYGIQNTDVGWDAFFGAAEILLEESRHMPVY